MLLNYITWDVSPFVYEGEHFAIGWYGTLWVLGLIGLLATLLLTFKHDKVPIQYAYITFMVTLVCVLFFGHLFQGLFYEWYYAPSNPVHFLGTDWYYRNYYFEHPWKFLDFAHGGFASHGGITAVMLLSLLYSKYADMPKWWLSDRLLLGVAFIGFLVRVGNFINGEICGIPTSLPWGVLFANSEEPAHPTQVYEILSYIIAASIGWWLYLRKRGGERDGLLSGIMLLIVFVFRLLVEFVKQPQMEIEQTWILNMGQWLSIPFIVLGIYLITYVKRTYKKM